MIKVEADLAAGDDFRLGEKRGEFGEGLVVGCGGAVGIDAGAGVKARKIGPILSSPVELAAEIERLVHLRRALADADREDRAHTGFPRAGEHGFAIVRVAGTVKVGVGIDQQTGLAVGMRNECGIWIQFNGRRGTRKLRRARARSSTIGTDAQKAQARTEFPCGR